MKKIYLLPAGRFARLLVGLTVGILLSSSVFAQTFSVTGKVLSDTQEAVGFAAVGFMHRADSSLAKTAVADEEGNFSVKGLKPGNYFAVIRSLGYLPFSSPTVEVTDQSLTLEPFVLITDAQKLETVEVTAQKPLVEVLADKTVFNVQNTVSAAGTNGFELLRKAPGVVIDNSDNVILEGKTGVQIYIDGKPSVLSGNDLSNFLKTLQASDIEAIELITQPSSKYDAAGSAGIINIKLKKDKNLGTNGSAGIGFGYGRYAKYNGSLSLNSRSKKVNVFSNYSTGLGKNWNYTNLYRTQSNTIFDAHSEDLTESQSHNIKVGTDFFASSKSTFGLILNGNFRNDDGQTTSRTPISRISESGPMQVLNASNSEKRSFENLTANLNYRFADTAGRTFNVDFDYGYFGGTTDSYQPNFYYNGDETVLQSQFISEWSTPSEINIMSLKADYEQKMWGGVFAVGFKLSQVKTDNTMKFYDIVSEQKTLNTDQSNNFVYTEQVNAAYFNYNRRWQKINIQFGLRAEQTVSEGQLNSSQVNAEQNVKRDYLNIFPSGGLTYQMNKDNSFALTYSKRIQRPNYQSLNPFIFRLDELTFRKGNPFLQPQYTDNWKLSHTFRNTLNTSLSYSFVSDFFAQVTQAEDERRNFIMQRNIANQKVWNLGVTYPFNIQKWWGVYMSLNANHSIYEGKDEKFTTIEQSTVNLYAQNNFTLPGDFKFEVSGWYNSPSVWGGTFVLKSMGALNLALQKNFADRKLSVRLAVNDVFRTSNWQGSNNFAGVLIDGNGGWESRNVRLNLTYNFGNNQVKSSRRRQTGIEDESNRIGN